MKYKDSRLVPVLFAGLLALAVSGCLFDSNVSSMSDKEAARRKMKEQPVTVINKEAPKTESTAASNEESVKRLEQDLKKQQAALEAERTGAKGPLPVESTAERLRRTAQAASAADKAADDLTADALLDRLSKKADRSPGEEEAYRRLSGAGQADAGMDDKSSPEWALLSDARDAVARNDFAAARDKAKLALSLIRRKTDPVIDRLCFATDVRNYGDADVVDPAVFGAGQRVLAVTDISDFSCMPAGNASPPDLYNAKISQRMAVYGAGGRLEWQNDYGTFEYQASHPISVMFIPRIFQLPRDIKSGQYTLKVEIADVLAGRRVEATTKFSVK